MTISAVYDFGSIRQHLAELVERKQVAVVGAAKPAESTFGYYSPVGQQVLPPPPPPKPIDSVYGWTVGNEVLPIGASRSFYVPNHDGTGRAVTEMWNGVQWLRMLGS